MNFVDRNPRPGYQSTCRYVRQLTCLFQLGWFEHVVHSNQYLQRCDTPLSLGVVQVPRTQQSRKACRNDQTVSLLFPTHRQPDFRYESRSHFLLLKYAYFPCLSVMSTVLGSTPALHVYVFASPPGDNHPE